ncbi:MAG: DNA/RNA nuclease SfsA [Clostridiaceae bacterium]|nr:DNA/RNA nuclease SfsA [Clostridiaceae bacterium]
MNIELESGIFIEECKSRFLCKVFIKEQEELCYVSSSLKLAPFIDLRGKEVLLTKNKGTGKRTKYTLYAIKTKESQILLNLSFVNKLLFTELSKLEGPYLGSSQIFSEKKISENLKSDFYIEGEKKIIVEAKGIISLNEVALFPAMKVERAVVQLKEFQKLLKKGFSVHYCLVLMNPAIKSIKLDKSKVDFYKGYRNCIKKGMQIFVYEVVGQKDNIFLRRNPIIEDSLLFDNEKRNK